MSLEIFSRSLWSPVMLNLGFANVGISFSFLQASRKSKSSLTLVYLDEHFSNWRHRRQVSFPCFSLIRLNICFRESSFIMKVITRSWWENIFFFRYFDELFFRHVHGWVVYSTNENNQLTRKQDNATYQDLQCSVFRIWRHIQFSLYLTSNIGNPALHFFIFDVACNHVR